jgi:hypothetical protein
MLCLLYEKYELGEKSAYMDYFRAMPEEFDTPAFWSETTAKELRGSDVYEKDIVEEYQLLNKVWNGLRRRVFDVYTDVFTRESSKSLYALRWAWGVVHARAVRVSGKDGLALVPVVDMIQECGKDEKSAAMRGGGEEENDDDEDESYDGSDTEAKASLEAGFAVYDKHTDTVVVYAKRDYAPNEEMCEHYGAWNNGESLQHFGYLPDVDEDDTRNCVLFVLEPPKKYAESVRKAGYEVPWRVCVPLSPTQASLEVLAAYAELASGRTVDVDDAGAPRHVSQVGVKEMFKERLARYPTTLDQDEYGIRVMEDAQRDFARAINRDDTPIIERARLELKLQESRHSALAIELRAREKRIIHRLVERVSYLDELAQAVKDEL